MKFSMLRRVDNLTADEIDAAIEEEQRKAERLVAELTQTIEAQAELWRHAKEVRPGDDA